MQTIVVFAGVLLSISVGGCAMAQSSESIEERNKATVLASFDA